LLQIKQLINGRRRCHDAPRAARAVREDKTKRRRSVVVPVPQSGVDPFRQRQPRRPARILQRAARDGGDLPEAAALGLLDRVREVLGDAMVAVESDIAPNPDVADLARCTSVSGAIRGVRSDRRRGRRQRDRHREGA
jgi:hypothetical protein